MVQPLVVGAMAGAGLLPAPNGGAQPPEYKATPAPSHVVEAIRIELKKIVDDPDLENRLDELGRIANQSSDLLACLKSPEAIMRHEHRMYNGPGGGVAVLPNNAETYGATILRQIVPALQEYQRASKETPEKLTEALATARAAGMTDVAAELEKKLFGRVLDGEKPIKLEDDPESQKPPELAVGSGG